MRIVVARIAPRQRLLEMPERPVAVWRWTLDTEPGTEIDFALCQPMHQGHDWTWRARRGALRYSFSDGGSGAWVVLQYGPAERRPCPGCQMPTDLEWRFCIACGHRLTVSVERLVSG